MNVLRVSATLLLCSLCFIICDDIKQFLTVVLVTDCIIIFIYIWNILYIICTHTYIFTCICMFTHMYENNIHVMVCNNWRIQLLDWVLCIGHLYIQHKQSDIESRLREKIPVLCVNLTTWLKVEIFKGMRRQSKTCFCFSVRTLGEPMVKQILVENTENGNK